MTDLADQTESFDAQLAAVAPALLEHLNGEHNDTLVFVATALGDVADVTGAVAVAIDAAGIDVRIDRTGGDPVVVRLPFSEPAAAVDQLTMRAFALIGAARERAGADAGPLTSLERERAEVDAIPTFFTQVVRTERRSPHLVRVTVGGGDLVRFVPTSPDQFMFVLLPPPGGRTLSIDETFTWEQYREMPPETRPEGAYYTVRHWRPDLAELDMDVVIHDDGPASAWASRAVAGDPLALWGPRTAYQPPADTDWYLLVGDETGLPAIGAIIDSLPTDAVVRAFVEVADEGERQPLRNSPTVEVTWLHRDGAPAGTTTAVIDAVRAMPWPGGTPYAWGGGESRMVTAVRSHLRHEIGLSREAVSMTGYWRHADSPVTED